MSLLVKQSKPVNIIQDITRAFNVIIKQKRLYLITITDTQAKHTKDLKFILTNQLFNKIKNENKNTFEFINYLFVIEYGSIISKGETPINHLDEHAHILVSSRIDHRTIEYYFHNTFNSMIDIYIDDITKRNDKEVCLGIFLNRNPY